MRTIMKVLLALGLVLAAGTPAEATEAEDLPITAPCDQDNVDCGEFPAPEEVPEGSPCTVTVDGVTYEGETNADGQCVCPDSEPEPTTTSTTVPETTTTTEPEPEPTTTTTVVEPTTTTTATEVTVPTVPETTEPPPAMPFEYANCTEAGGPVSLGEHGYGPHLDADGDGVGCELGEAASPVSNVSTAGELPRTGSNTPIVAGIGAGLLALGGSILLAKRLAVR